MKCVIDEWSTYFVLPQIKSVCCLFQKGPDFLLLCKIIILMCGKFHAISFLRNRQRN